MQYVDYVKFVQQRSDRNVHVWGQILSVFHFFNM